MDDLRSLTARFPRAGRLEAIVLRPGRDAPGVSVPSARALPERGLGVCAAEADYGVGPIRA